MGVDSRISSRRRIRRVVEFIDRRACGVVSLDEIAEVAAMSKFHLLRIYERATGETIGSTRARLRLNQARRMLAAGLSLQEVSRAVGYGSVQSFGHAFSRHFGLSPGKITLGSAVPSLPGRIIQLPRLTVTSVEFKGRIADVHDEFERLIARCEWAGAAIHPPSIMGVIDGNSLGEDGRFVTMRCMLQVDAPPIGLEVGVRPGGLYLAIRRLGPLPAAPPDLAAHVEGLRGRRLRFLDDFVLCVPARDPSFTAPSERVWDVFYPLASI